MKNIIYLSLKDTNNRLKLILALATMASPSLSLAAEAQPEAAPAETILHEFGAYRDGISPRGKLIFDTRFGTPSALYGTTLLGGWYSKGAVFKLTPPTPPATQWNYAVINSLGYNIADGEGLDAGLVFDSEGALYGATSSGGNFPGMVFKISPPVPPATRWTRSVLYRFPATNLKGSGQASGLVFGPGGALFGVRYGGGSSNNGVTYKLSPPVPPATAWSLSLLHDFGAQPDGAHPSGDMVFDKSGVLYGTTENGGASGVGTIYRLTPPVPPATQWSYSVLHTFNSSNGGMPMAGLIADSKGALYGSTFMGGSSGVGVVFRLSPPVPPSKNWTYAILRNFTGSGGSYARTSLVIDSAGVIYGTAWQGGSAGKGVVFSLTPPVPPATAWTHKVLYNFAGEPDGEYPQAGLVFDTNGALYGTTYGGGSKRAGTVFRLR